MKLKIVQIHSSEFRIEYEGGEVFTPQAGQEFTIAAHPTVLSGEQKRNKVDEFLPVDTTLWYRIENGGTFSCLGTRVPFFTLCSMLGFELEARGMDV